MSFEDPDEDRTWVVDTTFLSSGWECIFGAGCQGVLTGPAPELEHGCCSYGAHFSGPEDIARVQAAAKKLTSEQWQFKSKAKNGGITSRKGKETTTRLVEEACIFLNRPEFPGGAGCALHRAALESGTAPLQLKPDVCWQLPLRREDLTEESGHVVSLVSQWDRRHWGEAGQEFHWWCTEAAEAFQAKSPLYLRLADELVALVGKKIYKQICTYLEARRHTLLAHPVLRVKQKSARA